MGMGIWMAVLEMEIGVGIAVEVGIMEMGIGMEVAVLMAEMVVRQVALPLRSSTTTTVNMIRSTFTAANNINASACTGEGWGWNSQS